MTGNLVKFLVKLVASVSLVDLKGPIKLAN